VTVSATVENPTLTEAFEQGSTEAVPEIAEKAFFHVSCFEGSDKKGPNQTAEFEEIQPALDYIEQWMTPMTPGRWVAFEVRVGKLKEA